MKRKYLTVGLVLLTTYLLYKVNNWWEDWLHSTTHVNINLKPHNIYNYDEDPINEPVMDPECEKRDLNVAFLKTHKTGSSTITSILNRFADINNLDIAIPLIDNRFDWPYEFKVGKVDTTRLETKKASILCNHMVFNKKELNKLMKSPYKLVTILRDPVYQFRSLFYYHEMQVLYNFTSNKNHIENFFNNTKKHFRARNDGEFLYNSELLMKNGMIFDLNFRQFHQKYKSKSFNDFIEYIDNSFHLVLVTELFDESLILLKHLMCWKFMDIVYHKKLVNFALKKKNISDVTKQKIEKWSNLDLKLYRHFKENILNLIEEQKENNFMKDLKQFQTLNKRINNYCQELSSVAYTKIIKLLEGMKELPPNLFLSNGKSFCEKLYTSEKDYVRYFRNKYPPYHYIK